MATGLIKQVRTALTNLNPTEIRKEADRPVQVLTLASSDEAYSRLERFLTPATASEKRKWMGAQILSRADQDDAKEANDILLVEEGLPIPKGWVPGQNAFQFRLSDYRAMVREVIASRDDLILPLARRFEPFRQAAMTHYITTVSKENAIFSLMTALPNLIPSGISLPWAIGEFASDTAVMTANQIRLAFLLAAASDQEVGFSEQKGAVGSIVAGAWGWRTVARELVGKIPFGGGLIPKAAIAYAGTYVVGLSLERLYRSGYGLSADEKKEAYQSAFEKGKEIAKVMLEAYRRQNPGTARGPKG